MVDEINKGHGSLGKLVKDDALYNNATQTIATANKLITDLNAGRGAAGQLLKDEELARKLKILWRNCLPSLTGWMRAKAARANC